MSARTVGRLRAAGTRAPDFGQTPPPHCHQAGLWGCRPRISSGAHGPVGIRFRSRPGLVCCLCRSGWKKGVVQGGGAEGGPRCVALPSGTRPRPLGSRSSTGFRRTRKGRSGSTARDARFASVNTPQGAPFQGGRKGGAGPDCLPQWRHGSGVCLLGQGGQDRLGPVPDCARRRRVWRSGKRLSDSINSPFDERGAYLSKDGVLYFSSNRPGGLGGHDIYAVPWGQDGPVGRPERLPFPVNSVNDDEFFIPEPDGGAWMSSNRAAREGRIHAYRVALSALPFDAGSVSWLADEVASEGMTLRVYSRGEEVVTRVLNGEGCRARALPNDAQAVGVRIVLEDEEGRIVSESFGAGESAWELRKQGRGWTMVERDDVDWAMLADLRQGGRAGPPCFRLPRPRRLKRGKTATQAQACSGAAGSGTA